MIALLYVGLTAVVGVAIAEATTRWLGVVFFVVVVGLAARNGAFS